jgi:hypothetical protein
VSRLRLIPLASVEWAEHVALCTERLLRETTDPDERRRLKALRDWHFARLTDDQLRRERQ